MALRLLRKLRNIKEPQLSASQRVLNTTELLEHILSYLEPRDIRRARAVSLTWLSVIKGSVMLERKCLKLSNSKRREIKLLLHGVEGVGKECLLTCWGTGHFVEEYDPTLLECWRRVVDVDGEKIMVDLNRSGSEEFPAMQDYYLKDADAYALAYSTTSRRSYEKIRGLFEDIQRRETRPLLIGLLATKCDFIGQSPGVSLFGDTQGAEVSLEEGKSLARELGCPFFETSAKTQIRAEETLQALIMQYKEVLWRSRQPKIPVHREESVNTSRGSKVKAIWRKFRIANTLSRSKQ